MGSVAKAIGRSLTLRNQHIALVPQAIGEDKIKELMGTRYEPYEWGYYFTRMNREYCIVLRSDPVEDFIEILNSM